MEHSSGIALKCTFKLGENPEKFMRNAAIALNCSGKKSLDFIALCTGEKVIAQ